MRPPPITELVRYWDGTSSNQRPFGLQLCQKPLVLLSTPGHSLGFVPANHRQLSLSILEQLCDWRWSHLLGKNVKVHSPSENEIIVSPCGWSVGSELEYVGAPLDPHMITVWLRSFLPRTATRKPCLALITILFRVTCFLCQEDMESNKSHCECLDHAKFIRIKLGAELLVLYKTLET